MELWWQATTPYKAEVMKIRIKIILFRSGQTSLNVVYMSIKKFQGWIWRSFSFSVSDILKFFRRFLSWYLRNSIDCRIEVKASSMSDFLVLKQSAWYLASLCSFLCCWDKFHWYVVYFSHNQNWRKPGLTEVYHLLNPL